MNPIPRAMTNIVHRSAVRAIVIALVLAAHAPLFAAQCGGLPKGWRPERATLPSPVIPVLNVSVPDDLPALPSGPIPERHVPCRCTGASCSPAAPSPVPDQRVVSGRSTEASVERFAAMWKAPSVSHNFEDVESVLRYAVVFTFWRPPCDVELR